MIWSYLISSKSGLHARRIADDVTKIQHISIIWLLPPPLTGQRGRPDVVDLKASLVVGESLDSDCLRAHDIFYRYFLI